MPEKASSIISCSQPIYLTLTVFDLGYLKIALLKRERDTKNGDFQGLNWVTREGWGYNKSKM